MLVIIFSGQKSIEQLFVDKTFFNSGPKIQFVGCIAEWTKFQESEFQITRFFWHVCWCIFCHSIQKSECVAFLESPILY